MEETPGRRDVERRRFKRIKYPCKVKVYGQGSEQVFLTTTENISCGGLCIGLPKELIVYSPLDLEVDLKDNKPELKCSGRVVWSLRRVGKAGDFQEIFDTGVEFLNLEEEGKIRIKEIVDSYLEKQA